MNTDGIIVESDGKGKRKRESEGRTWWEKNMGKGRGGETRGPPNDC